MGDSDLPRTFEYVARRLGERNIAFLCAREYAGPDSLGPTLKAAFGGVYIANEKFTYESAEQAVQAGEADAVAFGKLFIANPDLPQRFDSQAPLNEPKAALFYAGGAEGYTDYPPLSGGLQSPDLNRSQARVNARVSSGV
jgi:2,4-dienoyl-CoA reductase-like NADH-dependent reductase (Old Yellow Enzyme family)